MSRPKPMHTLYEVDSMLACVIAELGDHGDGDASLTLDVARRVLMQAHDELETLLRELGADNEPNEETSEKPSLREVAQKVEA